jgi:hypothetical protein
MKHQLEFGHLTGAEPVVKPTQKQVGFLFRGKAGENQQDYNDESRMCCYAL